MDLLQKIIRIINNFFLVLVEKFVDRLLSEEAQEDPCDEGKPEELEMKLPEWFDEKKFIQLVFIIVYNVTTNLTKNAMQ